MAKCDKCNGRGWIENARYYHAQSKYLQSCYFLRFEPTINCRKCKGTGYVIGNVKDALDVLGVWKNNPSGVSANEFKKAVEMLEILFDETALPAHSMDVVMIPK